MIDLFWHERLHRFSSLVAVEAGGEVVGLQACRLAGYRAVIVVGHPDPLFGFSHSLVERLEIQRFVFA